MDLSYAKLRKVLSVFLKNPVLRKGLEDLLSGKQKQFDELGFLDLFDESQADIEILQILTNRSADEVSAEDATGVFADFFCSIKLSWEKFKPLLKALGLRVETSVQTHLKG